MCNFFNKKLNKALSDPGNHEFSRMAIINTFNKCKSLPQVSRNSLICFQYSFWYESTCSTIQSKHIPSIHSLRYSAVEHRVWDLGWMVGPEFVRILRGHRTGPKPEDNFTNLAIPNQRDSKRHVNSKAKELAVHSESIDLSTAIELLKERHEQGHKQAFMALSADAIYAGKVKMVPECINGSIIGAVDKHGSKSVYDIEDDLACLDKHVHCLIESLAWKRITDIYHAKEPENAKHNLKLALNYLQRYRTELVDAVIPDAKQSVKLLEKKLQANGGPRASAAAVHGGWDDVAAAERAGAGRNSGSKSGSGPLTIIKNWIWIWNGTWTTDFGKRDGDGAAEMEPLAMHVVYAPVSAMDAGGIWKGKIDDHQTQS
ncbi:hypothetical protein BDR26DRAFT_922803 [Obelidium mucronatum]|nr:hypothetical protein BDR26DRAFT_922803 [Obelidium mucronatum]